MSAREVARRVLDRVDGKAAWATLALDGELDRSGLDERDRRLASELVYGVLRNRSRIDRAIAVHADLSRSPPKVRTALRVAAYQLLFLDRVPAYAAVDDAVAAARAAGGQKLAGFANAVLRKVAARREPPLPAEGTRDRIAVEHSLPAWILDELAASVAAAASSAPSGSVPSSAASSDNASSAASSNHASSPASSNAAYASSPASDNASSPASSNAASSSPASSNIASSNSSSTATSSTAPSSAAPSGTAPLDLARIAAAFGEPAPIVARANRLRTTRAALAAQLAAAGVTAVPVGEDALRLEGIGDPARNPSFLAGAWTVQDAGAQRVAQVAAPAPGMRILDACSGVGGKATHLAELAGDRVAIDAADLSKTKLALLAETAQRLGITSIRTHACDLLDPAAPLGTGYDLIVLDAPCSGLGVLRRHPDAKWRLTADAVPRLADLQRQLLDAVVPRLAPTGALVYAVCTFTRAEGPDQIARLVERTGLRVVHEERTWPPDADAFYLARLTR